MKIIYHLYLLIPLSVMMSYNSLNLENMHDDPLSVLDILDVRLTNSFSHSHLLYVPLSPPDMSLLPLSFPLLHPLSISH